MDSFTPSTLHQQIHVVNKWKHARAVKQQRYGGFARSYLQPGIRERNTTKAWVSISGVLSGRLAPPSWLMMLFWFVLFFFSPKLLNFALLTLACFSVSNLSPSGLSGSKATSHAQKRSSPMLLPNPPWVWVRKLERREWNSTPKISLQK